MCVFLCVYVSMCVCVFLSVSFYLCVYVFVCVCLSQCVCVVLQSSLSELLNSTDVCVCVCVCVWCLCVSELNLFLSHLTVRVEIFLNICSSACVCRAPPSAPPPAHPSEGVQGNGAAPPQ